MGEQKRYVIGIDGGGTKTDALLVAMDGSVLAECNSGPVQLSTVGIKQAATTLINLIKDCCSRIECSSQSIDSIVLGIAGSGRSSDRVELANFLQSLSIKKKFPLKNVAVETDARIALEAAFAGGPGIVIIGGTGSIALYQTEDGKILRAGGWGSILGDEGSGFAIARDALNAVMRQHDGRGERTLLTQKAFEHFGINVAEDIIPKIYHERVDVAAFAPKVFAAADERDRTAHLILVKNAGDLADLARVLTLQARPRKKMPVALMGGVLEPDNSYAKLVKEKIVSSLPQVVVQKAKFPAAFGAAILGLNAFR